MKIRVTRSQIRKFLGPNIAAANAISKATGLPIFVGSNGIIEVDDPVTGYPSVVKLYQPRSLSRAINRWLKRGYSTVQPFTFIMPNKEVKKQYVES